MARSVTLNGSSYSVPEPGDYNYGQQLTSFLVSLTTAFLANAGNAVSPSGTVDGANRTFTLPATPAGAVMLFKAPSTGSASLQVGGVDYAIGGTTITFTTAPAVGSLLRAFY